MLLPIESRRRSATARLAALSSAVPPYRVTSSLVRVWRVTWLAVLALVLTGCLPEGSSSRRNASFEVRGLDVAADQPVARDHEVQVVFSDSVNPMSVDEYSIQLFPGPDFVDSVPLGFDFAGNAAVLHLRDRIALRPETEYLLRVAGLNLHAPQSRTGEILDQTFEGYFQTSREFEAERTPPFVLVDDLRSEVRALREIEIPFSEPVQPDVLSAEPWILTDRHGDVVPGRFELTLSEYDATPARLEFVPEYEPLARDSYTLTLANDLGDLAGNLLVGPTQFVFDVDPRGGHGRPVRQFDLTSPVDLYRGESLAATGAVRLDPTELTALGSERAMEALTTPTWTRGNDRLVQLLYRPEDLGDAGAVHRLYFETLSRPDVASIFDSVEIRIWHTKRDQLSNVFAENRPRGRSRMNMRAIDFLSVPAEGPHDFFALALDEPFEYDGVHNVVIEVRHHGGSREIESASWLQNGVARVSGSARDAVGQVDSYVDAIRFGILRPDRFVEWNSFVDLGTPDAELTRPVLYGNVPFIEDFVLVEFEGTTRATPDGRSTGARSDYDAELSATRGYRYLRFRMHLLRDSVGGTPIELDRILLPIYGATR